MNKFKRSLRNTAACTLTALTLLGNVPSATAAAQWHTSTLRAIYPMADGQFVLVFSTDAPNSIVVHGDVRWEVDFTGKVSVSSGEGEWHKDSSAGVTSQKWIQINALFVKGTDAADAGFEVFPPNAADSHSKPKKFRKKP